MRDTRVVGFSNSGTPGSQFNAYIVDLYAADEPGRGMVQLGFDYMPEQFNESKNASYANIDIVGRSEPYKGYSNSGSRVLSLNLIIGVKASTTSRTSIPSGSTVDYTDPQNVTTNSYSSSGTNVRAQLMEKEQKVNFIKSLVYPDYEAPGTKQVRPPPRVMVVLGSQLTMIGIVSGWNIVHRAPYDSATMIAYFSEVSFSVEETEVQPFSNLQVKGGRVASR